MFGTDDIKRTFDDTFSGIVLSVYLYTFPELATLYNPNFGDPLIDESKLLENRIIL